MALSMVINESLVARTFATYALRPFDMESDAFLGERRDRVLNFFQCAQDRPFVVDQGFLLPGVLRFDLRADAAAVVDVPLGGGAEAKHAACRLEQAA